MIYWIAGEVGPELIKRGILFAGLDVIGDFLTEINITSPTCIRELDREYKLDIAGDLMDSIVKHLRGMTTTFLSSSDRLGLTLFLAAALHLFLILGVSFKFEDRNKNQYRQQSLEIMVVQHPKAAPKKQETADYLAQISQAGGGEPRAKTKPTTRALPPIQPVSRLPNHSQSRNPFPRPP